MVLHFIRRWPPAFRWSLGVLVALEAAYVAAGVALVESGQVERWLNAHPEKRVVRFDSAWTILPGVAHVRGFQMVSQGRGNQLQLDVDHAVGLVNPFELLARRVHVLGLQARGVEFRYRKRPKSPEDAAARETLVPPIEGVRFEPYSGPPPGEKKKRGWTVVFTGATVREIRDVWMGQFRLRGPATVAASVTVGPGNDRSLSIRAADVRFQGGSFQSAGETGLGDLDLHVRGRMRPFSTRQTRGRALLGLVSAKVELAATSPGDVLLNQYFGKAGWLAFDSGKRVVTARVEVERGRLRSGGFVDLGEGPLRVDLAGFVAEGTARARLETVLAEGEDAADAQVTVAFDAYGMRREIEGAAVLHGDGLRIEARSPADLFQLPATDFDGRIDLGTAEFPDLTFVNELLPGGAGLVVRGGRGSVDGTFETGEGAACHGRATITTKGLMVEAGGVENSGDVAVTVEVPDGNLRDLTFALEGTRAALTHFAFAIPGAEGESPDWQGRITVTDGTLKLGETPEVDARVELTFSDTRPLVAFLSRDEPLKGWKRRLLTIEELNGEGVARLTKGSATIRHLGVRGENMDVRFRALIDARGALGKARARYGFLKAGIGLRGRERSLHVLRVGHWYQEDDIPGMPPLLPEFEEIGAR
jgi:hypothetical protein